MKGSVSAVLLYVEPSPVGALKAPLGTQCITTTHARSCGEVMRLLAGPTPPELVFTDTQFPDGTWQDVIRIAEEAPTAVNVIVVSRLVDVGLYIEAIERGAFDFITPPFESAELAHVIRCAVANVLIRRQREARREQAHQDAAA